MSDDTMPGGAELLDSLRGAVDRDPADLALRYHLAQVLLEHGETASALEHACLVLERTPDHENALAVAAEAARAVGDDRAERFQRLLEALRASSRKPAKRRRSRAKIDDSAEADSSQSSAPEDERTAVVRLHSVPGGKRKSDDDDAERPGVTLRDVGGMEDVKRRLRVAFLAPLANPALRRMYGKSLRGGLLLWGPPGCGKTFIARATAGELGARFVAIGLHDVLDMWFGESERKLHDVFEDARRNSPCVLFVDEVDALGRKRSQLRYSAGREVVVQFLSELDGMSANNEGVFVLAATNHPWDVDTAFRRPGRFDRMVLVLPPDAEAREAILRYHLRERPVGDVDLVDLAARTDLFSGADLAHLCESAAEYGFEDSVLGGEPRPIGTEDFERALAEISPSTLPWLEAAKNYAEFAGEPGTYERLLDFLREKNLA